MNVELNKESRLMAYDGAKAVRFYFGFAFGVSIWCVWYRVWYKYKYRVYGVK
jgi:hypothetical protein